MMHKVFHHTCLTFAEIRCLDRAVRRLRFPQYSPALFVDERPFSKICCSSDYRMYANIKLKPLVSANCVSTNYFPQIISKLDYSSEKHDKSQWQGSEEAKPKQTSHEEKSKRQDSASAVEPLEDEKKLSIFQRFKKMYRDYCGVDILTIVEALGVSNRIPDVLKDSSAGYLAVAYALYKIATPVRYMVTIGGTTISIKYLKEYGYIKPIPPAGKLKEMYQEKKENLKEKSQNFAVELKQKKDQFKGRSQTLMRDRRQQAQK
ncbi:Angiotensin-converting enzyme [Gryllus bimaculatus]|nr:Angiotensin-converting enzyme [Gryllus bimaculatus]